PAPGVRDGGPPPSDDRPGPPRGRDRGRDPEHDQPRGPGRDPGRDGARDRDFERRGERGRPPGPPRPEFLAEVPPDFLRRIGQDERDQPYFVVWMPDGTVARRSVQV